MNNQIEIYMDPKISFRSDFERLIDDCHKEGIAYSLEFSQDEGFRFQQTGLPQDRSVIPSFDVLERAKQLIIQQTSSFDITFDPREGLSVQTGLVEWVDFSPADIANSFRA